MKGESTRQTGDINLAAALMACAIPLSDECPVRIIESAGFKSYATFSVTGYSADGRHVTEKLMAHWSHRQSLPADHPFSMICDFIAARPDGKMTISDWLDHAVDYLSRQGVQLPGLRSISDIPAFVARVPSLPESYILAFVANRDVCINLYHAAKRSIFQSVEQSHTLIDSKLPVWQRNELLSRLQG